MTEAESEARILTRRQLMAAGAAAGATATGLGALQFAPNAAATTPPHYRPGLKDRVKPPVAIFSDSEVGEYMTFQALFALGNISAMSGDYGEITTVIKRINDRGASYLAFYEEFVAEAQKVAKYGDYAAQRGRRITARNAYLRAAAYYSQSLFFVLARSSAAELQQMAIGLVTATGRSRERAVYRAMTAVWEKAGEQMRPQMEVVQLPYKGPQSPMPGWFLRPSGDRKRRPTVIMNNGSDAQAIELWGAGGYAALERGWNVLMFSGPGQGGMLFEKNQTFIPEWEKVITPIVDWLRRRSDVDRDRIVLTGSSFGGMLVPRAAAFEPRLAAVSMDPGVVYASSGLTDGLSNFPGMLEAFSKGDKETFNNDWERLIKSPGIDVFAFAKQHEIFPGSTFFEKYTALIKYDNRAVLPKIKCPALVIDNEIEQFFPGQPKMLFDLLRNSRGKKLVKFMKADGAQYHCEPMNPQRRNDAVMDFFGDVVGR